jgi:MFS family permease
VSPANIVCSSSASQCPWLDDDFVALPWQLFQLDESSVAVGMLGVAEFVAILSMALVGGALADYIDRRRLVRLSWRWLWHWVA